MGHLEGNFTPVLYMGRKVTKGKTTSEISTRDPCWLHTTNGQLRELLETHFRPEPCLLEQQNCSLSQRTRPAVSVSNTRKCAGKFTRCTSGLVWTLLGASAKLRKGTISFVMHVCLSVRPSVHMEQLDSH